ncbi:hypothetical protein MRB53_022562 [Persea americana]|uniref:Uncharacterized protein n=1 Tax=Persea americana TaxID=3435 RepID=A0ACC2L741_PERAE|nr:hypothetical protein MRB53_022562 [Persea americana]
MQNIERNPKQQSGSSANIDQKKKSSLLCNTPSSPSTMIDRPCCIFFSGNVGWNPLCEKPCRALRFSSVDQI